MSPFPGTSARTVGAAASARESGGAATNGAGAALVGCIDRLEQLIEREIEALGSPGPIDFEDFNMRKTHALLEFSRASRAFPGPGPEALEQKLARLRARLVENGALLDRRLQAIREISAVVIRTMEMAESDGTYTNRFPAQR